MTGSNNSFLNKALYWANQFDVCCLLSSNNYPDRYAQFDTLIAAGTKRLISANHGNAFKQLQSFYENNPSWLFGWFGYDLKNETEQLTSNNIDGLDFEDLFFFEPENLIVVKNGVPEIVLGDKNLLQQIEDFKPRENQTLITLSLEQRLSKNAYIERVNQLKNHILRGDIYEVTFCQEFFAQNVAINPAALYQELVLVSPTPFAGFFKNGKKYILSATPERFLQKKGTKLISQPIKGTAKRSPNSMADEAIKTKLKNDPKERAENVMIVDLVRHDLTKTAVKGSVKVEELFGLYSFPQVHQMISTISCSLDPKNHFINAIKDCFPMGSMTGAPKLRAMQLIEDYEESKRGVYSGSFGYITPAANFDFNVVIRSILYNQAKQYLSFQVGSAITHQSNPENEYEECLLKASAIKSVLNKFQKK